MADERRIAARDDAVDTSAAPGDSLVRFAGVSVIYPSRDGPIRALDTVDLAFGADDFICVVGP